VVAPDLGTGVDLAARNPPCIKAGRGNGIMAGSNEAPPAETSERKSLHSPDPYAQNTLCSLGVLWFCPSSRNPSRSRFAFRVDRVLIFTAIRRQGQLVNSRYRNSREKLARFNLFFNDLPRPYLVFKSDHVLVDFSFQLSCVASVMKTLKIATIQPVKNCEPSGLNQLDLKSHV